MSACTPRIGIWAAILSVLFAACFSIVALAANFTMLIPAIWVNPLSFAPSLLLAWSYLLLMACVLDAAMPEHRVWAVLSLCFAVLGANDGIVSTASLVVGVAAAAAGQHNILVTGVAGMVAGAMSMATGEYVLVHSQADTEKADLSREKAELQSDPATERRELTSIYIARGLAPGLGQ